jgi:hypothetical protein
MGRPDGEVEEVIGVSGVHQCSNNGRRVPIQPRSEGGDVNVIVSRGLSSTVGLIAIAVSLLVALILTVISLGAFSGGSGSVSSGILSNSKAEHQTQLCAEGRDSSYGDPPSQAQQAACLDEIAHQAGGGGGSAPIVPTTTTPGNLPSLPAG